MDLREKIGFNKVLEYLDRYLSDIGRTLLSQINFSVNYQKISNDLKSISEFIDILSNHNFPVDYYFDLRSSLKKIEVKGLYLNEIDLLRLALSLQTLKAIKQFFANVEFSLKFNTLRKLANKIAFFPFIVERIYKVINKQGEILDSASKELLSIRRNLLDLRTRVNVLIQSIYKQAKAQGIVEADANIVVRGGKFLIPVLAAKKNRLPGIVQDQSATGKTVYIEPFKLVELHNEITELEFAEKREIIRILTQLADDIRPYIPELLYNYEILAEFDFIRAKALLAIEMEAEMPQLVDYAYIDLQKARHPLLFLSYKKIGKKVVPLDLKLDDKERIVLISGPNAGGKSVALKTVGLVQYMVQCGFLPPVRFSSTIGIFDEIFIDIGDDQSIENDLSTYTSRLLNIKKIVEQATENSLVLIDEFGSGTDPTFGGALAEAVLEEFLKKKVKAVITTHYSNLKHFASIHQGIVNAAMLFDSDNLKPLYILQKGRPGSSFAFEIASSIGLSEKIISSAKSKLGQSQVDFDNILLDLEKERQKLTSQREKYDKLIQELKEKAEKYKIEYEKLLREKKQIIRQANEQVDELMARANSLIENTIRQIKEKQANKQATRNIRMRFEKQKKSLNIQRRKLETQVNKALESVVKKHRQKKHEITQIQIGDYVKHNKTGIKGQVLEIKDNRALVLMGNIKTILKLNELEKLSSDEARDLKQQEKKGGVKVDMQKPNQFITALDVRGLRVDEALQKVVKFLDAALVANIGEIRILHGTGDGILRKNIREYLSKEDFVQWYGDAEPKFGGPGITIVRLK